MKYEQLSSYELWGLIQSADQEAFAYIFTTNSDDIFKYGQKFTTDCELIEDVIQDIFVRLWELKNTLVIHSSIRFYLFSTFRRELVRRLKINQKHQLLEDYHSSVTWEDSFQEILIENQITQESSMRISSALDNLSTRQKEAIYLKYMQDMSYEEISSLMGIKVPSLYNLVLKGLKSMKQFLTSSDYTAKVILLFGIFV
ncbi:RNA polymerase sigma factor [Cyclobacterium marinum]|uniref:RNA polymerase, sigma-24 subunit, ECF subfamily n=1 Tax=Cyclobacterium marinum (strain ATCC 25205 / DSM 745 / LMG 13164 / NCIMB 1802) TaxID=880070 RepID=G0IZG7_CYCMS|nr:sigma-70 family RNA polymerase sigma factor [Cyclobacterium marinum]AEL25008.1 RNA polymerase, sigma-24 subunit, ECF subfamily [Cyclobacterium marinum DSM 745]MBI0401523.1 sigma-70 family RNA polymerase sigma factor [Cyclobacterium marinum]|tara:strand:+ start:24215 stop:24811 length:597 start_codon:yes stop_codon:yes gene_type:complete